MFLPLISAFSGQEPDGHAAWIITGLESAGIHPTTSTLLLIIIGIFATKGIFTFSSLALANGSFANIAINGGIATAADGKISGVALGLTGQDNTDKVIGTVIGTGTRTSQGNTDQFAGNFVVVKLG